MSSSALRTAVSGLGFAEAPRWHGERLWFVDYFSRQVRTCALTQATEVVAEVQGTPGGLGFLPDGTPLVVSQRDFSLLAIGRDGALKKHAGLAKFARGAANELLVDERGRAYVGHHGFDFFGGAPPQPSTLLLVDGTGSVREVADELTFPNGMALTADGRTLIVAETFAARLTAFDVAADGSLARRRVWAQLPNHTPDGLCLDESGAVWVGSPLSARFLRVREGGEILEEIPTRDGRWAVACVFGGAGRRTLCCVTAATTLEDMPKGKSEAFIELADVGVKGGGRP